MKPELRTRWSTEKSQKKGMRRRQGGSNRKTVWRKKKQGKDEGNTRRWKYSEFKQSEKERNKREGRQRKEEERIPSVRSFLCVNASLLTPVFKIIFQTR